MSGAEGIQSDKMQVFAEELRKRFRLPVHLWDERLTSVEANRLLRSADLSIEKRGQAVDRMAAVLIVDERCVLLEDRVLTAAGRVLQLEDRVGVEQVVFAVTPPLVLAAPFQIGLADDSRRIRTPMPLQPTMIAVHKRRFEPLAGAGVAGDAGRRPDGLIGRASSPFAWT